MDTYQLYIGGKFRDAEDGATKPTLNPWNSQAIANIPVATEMDALDAIAGSFVAGDAGRDENLVAAVARVGANDAHAKVRGGYQVKAWDASIKRQRAEALAQEREERREERRYLARHSWLDPKVLALAGANDMDVTRVQEVLRYSNDG